MKRKQVLTIKNFTDEFGSMVFNKDVMRQRLAPEVFEKLEDIIDNGGEMDTEVANAVAEAMMNWAIEKGATHYTHWFQPMTGLSAEKHDSFIQPDGEGGVGLGITAASEKNSNLL